MRFNDEYDSKRHMELVGNTRLEEKEKSSYVTYSIGEYLFR